MWIAQASASVRAKTVAIAAITGPFGVGVTFVVNSTQAGALAMTVSAQSATAADGGCGIDADGGADGLPRRLERKMIGGHDAEELRPRAAHRPEDVRMILLAFAAIIRPSARTTSTAVTEKQAKPHSAEFQPTPPPSR